MTDVAVTTIGQIVISGQTLNMAKIRMTEDGDGVVTIEGVSDKHPGSNWDSAESGNTEGARQLVLRMDATTAAAFLLALTNLLA